VANKILSNLWKVKGSSIFHTPVDPLELNIKDYFSVVKLPMDFSLIKNKLSQNLYESFHHFKEDLDLVFYNCQLYNGTDSHVGQMGVQVRVQYEKLLETIAHEWT
jgi:bromodomain-containing factor 1